MEEFKPIIASVIAVFLVMGVGAVCRWAGWLTAEADRTLANLTANVLLPAYFLKNFSSRESADQLESLATTWQAPLMGFLTTAIGFGIALLFARKIGPLVGLKTDASQRAFALCAGICNYGYIPLPLAERFYQTAVIDLIVHNVGVTIALWSIGISIISGTGGDSWKKTLTSIPLWAVVLSIAMSLVGLTEKIPDSVQTAIDSLGSCAIPMGLLLSGAIIIDFVRDRSWIMAPGVILSAIGIRQILLPAILIVTSGAVVTTTDLRTVAMLQAAMPSAVFPIVLAKLYDRDTQTALRVVLGTSLAGLVMIPLWLAIGAWWLGLSQPASTPS
ncbi:AEC family transporter [Roseiconus lacunae]|uniref:AEC family transporter n=1 Tax=Roseiconus lacunae TaxID=2605694 RepID=A0ABT7PCA5_9BACT|nr:AEC family transporter [Roseiconus lacunae]MCD0463152.1 AEC family transporter [Roseiconus lacunae]MDM4014124.1 AEC family transporter [Roseiconus lacunae]WRQ53425.1 AEC family transporter [Stieleria sp. HD01]